MLSVKSFRYRDCYKAVKDCDVLLFRAPKSPFRIGFYIGLYTSSLYSHVGLANWNYGILQCAEFRELIGSRNIPLLRNVMTGCTIDVYRPIRNMTVPVVKVKQLDGGVVEYKSSTEIKDFSQVVREKIINEARNLMGLPYSYWTIIKLAKAYIPFLRFTLLKDHPDNVKHKGWVCSTFIAHLFRKYYFDLNKFISDDAMTPADVSQSSILQYQFSIKDF